MPSSLSDKVCAALVDIRENIEAIRTFLLGVERFSFERDKKTFYAVTRALEIISEASRKVPEDIKARYPRIAWHSIRDAGNVYRHSYDRAEPSLVWETAQNDLDVLAAMVEAEIGADEATKKQETGADHDRTHEA